MFNTFKHTKLYLKWSIWNIYRKLSDYPRGY